MLPIVGAVFAVPEFLNVHFLQSLVRRRMQHLGFALFTGSTNSADCDQTSLQFHLLFLFLHFVLQYWKSSRQCSQFSFLPQACSFSASRLPATGTHFHVQSTSRIVFCISKNVFQSSATFIRCSFLTMACKFALSHWLFLDAANWALYSSLSVCLAFVDQYKTVFHHCSGYRPSNISFAWCFSRCCLQIFRH